MGKIDLKKDLAELYPARKSAMKPHLVDVPEALFIMIDGAGDPNRSARFQEATSALYAIAYAAKFACKEAGSDFAVMPLEGLWWGDSPEVFTLDKKNKWKWTLMIRQPDVVTERMLDHMIGHAEESGKIGSVQAADVRVERFAEGKAAQVLHLGPYDEEGPVIKALHQFARDQGLSLRGKHHEIYLGDPRRSAPEKLKTVLRQPVG